MKPLLLLILLALTGCVTHDEGVLISSTRNGSSRIYVYYEGGRYVAYVFKDGALASRQEIEKP